MTHIVWRERADNPWLSMARDVVLGFLPPPGEDARTCGPGPFSMFDEGTVRRMMEIAGYEDITFEHVDAPVLIGRNVVDAIDFQLAIGPAGEVHREAGPAAEARSRAPIPLELALGPCSGAGRPRLAISLRLKLISIMPRRRHLSSRLTWLYLAPIAAPRHSRRRTCFGNLRPSILTDGGPPDAASSGRMAASAMEAGTRSVLRRSATRRSRPTWPSPWPRFLMVRAGATSVLLALTLLGLANAMLIVCLRIDTRWLRTPR